MNRLLILIFAVTLLCTFALGAEDLPPSHEPATVPSTTRTAKTMIVLAGDSTVGVSSGWGPGFEKRLTGDIQCINMGKNGRSSKSYRAEGWWKKCLAAKPDYILIQFGHNDQHGKGPTRETDPETTYRANMERYVDEARAAGIKPILVTSLARRDWKPDGSFVSSLIPNAKVVKEIAAAKNVPLIDLHEKSIELYKKLGVKGFDEYSPLKPDGSVDTTHLNEKGSVLIGTLVADELKIAVPELAPNIN